MDDSNGMDLDISGSIKTTRSSIAEIKDNKEIWIGLSDPAERRKLQNRLHQRAWREYHTFTFCTPDSGVGD